MNVLRSCIFCIALMTVVPFLSANTAEPQKSDSLPRDRYVSMHDLFYHTEKTLRDLKKDGYRLDFPDQVIRNVAEKLENCRSTTVVLSGYIAALAGLFALLELDAEFNPHYKSMGSSAPSTLMEALKITSALSGIAALPLFYYKWTEQWYQKKLNIILQSQTPAPDEQIKRDLERARLEMRKKSHAILAKSVLGFFVIASVLLGHN